MLACAALTSDDLPMPRAPHSSALLAGRPLAKRSVFSIRMSRIRSMPFRRLISTRLTRGTGDSRPSGCQTKASAPLRESADPAAGALADRCAAMVSSASAILAACPFVNAAGGRFVTAVLAGPAGLREAAFAAVLLDFLAIAQVPDSAALSGLGTSRKRPK